MSRSLNKVTLIGNLGADPEVRSTTGGNRVATFSLATSRSWNGPSGDKQEKTEWHRCVVWNSKASTLADIVERYLKKGDKIYVEGRIEYRQWQDKENQTASRATRPAEAPRVRVRRPRIGRAVPAPARAVRRAAISRTSAETWTPRTTTCRFNAPCSNIAREKIEVRTPRGHASLAALFACASLAI